MFFATTFYFRRRYLLNFQSVYDFFPTISITGNSMGNIFMVNIMLKENP